MLRLKRITFLILSIGALCVSGWITSVLSKPGPIVPTINRMALFFLLHLHAISIVFLLWFIARHSIKLFIERKQQTPGSVFKRNLIFVFILFATFPAGTVFFMAGKLISKSIDTWFKSEVVAGLSQAHELHIMNTQSLRSSLRAWAEKAAAQNFMTLHKEGSFCGQLLERTDVATSHFIHHEAHWWRLLAPDNKDRSVDLVQQFVRSVQRSTVPRVFDFFGCLYAVIPNQSERPSVFLASYHYPKALAAKIICVEKSILEVGKLSRMRRELFWNYLYLLIMGTLVMIFLAIWAGFYLAKGISQPIKALLVAMSDMGKGHWPEVTLIDHASDFNRLAHGFNIMTQQLRQAQNHVLRQHKQLSLIISTINEAVVFLGPTARVLMANAAAQKLFKELYKTSLIQGSRIHGIPEKEKAIIRQALSAIAQEKKHHHAQEYAVSYGAEERSLIIHTNIIISEESFHGLLIVIDDVTQLVRTNRIKVWQEAAQRMAHEIKNPLTPIQLATQRLRRRFGATCAQDETFDACTTTILDHVAIIKNLVHHFSAFARLPEQRPERIDLNTIIEKVLRLYRISYPEIAFIATTTTIPAICADVREIQRVLVNLLDNSVRALHKISPTIQPRIIIGTTSNAEKSFATMTIFDNGPGIPEQLKSHIFLPHVTSSRRQAGLGLAIVYDIIIQSGGSIDLIEQTEGTLFKITLPAHKPITRL